jgi:hypothetical protein
MKTGQCLRAVQISTTVLRLYLIGGNKDVASTSAKPISGGDSFEGSVYSMLQTTEDLFNAEG